MHKEKTILRCRNVQQVMRERKIDQLLITNPMSVFYLTGEMIEPFERFWGFYLPKEGEGVLISNRLFHLVHPENFQILWYEDGESELALLKNLIKEQALLGVDEGFPAKWLIPLLSVVPSGNICCDSACVRQVRAIKTEAEIRLMKESAAIADACADKIPEFLAEGITELELGETIAKYLKELGADKDSCQTPLVAFGENGGDAHHSPGERVLRKGDGVLVDLGCRKGHYCSDITRTFFFGEPDEKWKKIYEVVYEAQKAAIQAVRPGVLFCALDKIARDIIETAGFGRYFTHRLGHSIGLEGHECEDVSAKNKAVVKAGMTFSIEPGIYIPGMGGVRIEDIVLVTETGCRILNHAKKRRY